MDRFQATDNELVRLFIDGDHSALEILIKRHKTKLFSYIMSLVKDRALAEDIFQDTFIKAIRSLKSEGYKDDGRFVCWITRIAHNLVIDYYRKQKNYKEVLDGDNDVSVFDSIRFSEGSIEQTLTKNQISKDLKKMIRQLPDEQRTIVLMRLQFNMSFKEIADQTNVSINTALGRMRYAIINLKKMIEENNISCTVN